MSPVSKRLTTLTLLPLLTVSAVCSARSLGSNPGDTVEMTMLVLTDSGTPTQANFGPYDIAIDGVSQDGFHFELLLAEETTWVAACATGDGNALLCSFYAPAGDHHGFLAVDTRADGLTSGTLKGPRLQVEVVSERTGWALTEDQMHLAGLDLLGRDKVWFERSGNLEAQPLLAAAAGALWVFEEVR